MSKTTADTVVWHDLECGTYRADLGVWRNLASQVHGPILDVGAGTGRVSIALAKAGHSMLAMDLDPQLLATLRERSSGLAVRTVQADAREFSLPELFELIIVPMQTLQLLGDSSARQRFLRSARRHLKPGGRIAMAISDVADFEEFEWHDGDPHPLPDLTEINGCVYSSQPTAVRREGTVFALERLRTVVDTAGTLRSDRDRIDLNIVTVELVQADAALAGLKVLEPGLVPATKDHIASQVVIVGA